MSMLSNVGNPQVYEDGDQRNSPGERPKDHHRHRRRSSAVDHHVDLDDEAEYHLEEKLSEAGVERRFSQCTGEDHTQTKKNPLNAALAHGNKPSRGAMVDAQIKAEEEQLLREKEERKAQRERSREKMEHENAEQGSL